MSSRSGKVSWSPYTDEDDAKTTLACTSRREKHVERPPNIDVGGLRGLSDRARNRAHRTLVEDDRTPVGRLLDRILIAQIRLDEPHLGEVRQVFEFPVGQVVQAADLVTVGDEPATQVRADEPGAPVTRVLMMCRATADPTARPGWTGQCMCP
jgi:hypothetical protein